MSEVTGVSSSSGMIPLQGGSLVEAVDEAPNLILDESISLKPNCSALSVPSLAEKAGEHDDNLDDDEDLELDEEDDDFDEDDLLDDDDDEEDDNEDEELLEDEELEDDEPE